MADKRIYCSFCGKHTDEVAKIIAGPTVFICNECVALCLEICLDEFPQADPAQISALIARVASPPPKPIFNEAQEARIRELISEGQATDAFALGREIAAATPADSGSRP